jgi:hypothetical protein
LAIAIRRRLQSPGSFNVGGPQGERYWAGRRTVPGWRDTRPSACGAPHIANCRIDRRTNHTCLPRVRPIRTLTKKASHEVRMVAELLANHAALLLI